MYSSHLFLGPLFELSEYGYHGLCAWEREWQVLLLLFSEHNHVCLWDVHISQYWVWSHAEATQMLFAVVGVPILRSEHMDTRHAYKCMCSSRLKCLLLNQNIPVSLWRSRERKRSVIMHLGEQQLLVSKLPFSLEKCFYISLLVGA